MCIVAAFLLGWVALLVLSGMLIFRMAKSTTLKVGLSILLGLGAVGLLFATFHSIQYRYERGNAQLHLCSSYLREMGLCISMYRDDFNGSSRSRWT